MKISLLFLLLFMAVKSQSQNLANHRVVNIFTSEILGSINSANSYLSGTQTTETKSSGIRATFGASIGKFNTRNIAVLYGVEIPLRFNHVNTPPVESNETELGISPSVSVLKLIPISNSLYWGSTMGIRAGYRRYRSKISGQSPELIQTWEARVFYRPLDFIWYFYKQTALTFGIWDGYISYQTEKSSRANGTIESKTIANSLALNGRFNITVGIQILLNH